MKSCIKENLKVLKIFFSQHWTFLIISYCLLWNRNWYLKESYKVNFFLLKGKYILPLTIESGFILKLELLFDHNEISFLLFFVFQLFFVVVVLFVCFFKYAFQEQICAFVGWCFIIEKADIICVSNNDSSNYLNKSSIQWQIILIKYVTSVRLSLESPLNKKSLNQKRLLCKQHHIPTEFIASRYL